MTSISWALEFFEPPAREQNLPESKQAKAVPEQPLRCKICGYAITSIQHRIEVNGNYEHHCINPAGIKYHIGCFTLAPGCACLGPASEEYTWFTGYAWQMCVCSDCGEHLGWRFVNSDEFFGLILARLSQAN